MHPNVHNSVIYNSQDIEATQVPINRKTDEEGVVHLTPLPPPHTQWNYYLAIKKE